MSGKFSPQGAAMLAATTLALLAGTAFWSAPAYSADATQGELIVYTALVPKNLAPYAKAFNAAYPNVKLTWVREASGMIAARMLAEKDSPRADVVWGVGLPEVIALDQQGLLEHYAPEGTDALKKQFVDQRHTPPAWTGLDMYLNVVCFNEPEGAARNLPAPKTWEDLTNPIYRGQVTVPSPQMTSTGFVYIQSWIAMMGEEKAWEYMQALDKNVAMYTNSSTTPCKQAASGEYTVGLSSDITAPELKAKGAPIQIIVPSEKTGWGIEAMALVKGSRNEALAKKLLDFAVSKQANEVYAQYNGTVAYPGVNSTQPEALVGGEKMAVDIDLAWGNENRDRILKKWGELFGAKSEKKQ